MKKLTLLAGFVLLLFPNLHAQLDIDRPINLNGSNASDRRVTNLSAPVNENDAANKYYVDSLVAANAGGSGHFVGELFGGGVVYAVHKDATGNEHGLIVSLVDNLTSVGGAQWSNVASTLVGTTSWDGSTRRCENI